MEKVKIEISKKQKDIIEALGDDIFTADFLEEWINRHDDIDINAFAALQAVSAKGFYRAVLAIEKSNLNHRCYWCNGHLDDDYVEGSYEGIYYHPECYKKATMEGYDNHYSAKTNL